ncbi:MAG: hypothetical protein VXW00_09035 [Candidatus Latescibacterota bacterium]|nr:hypothetical protein [Candidatus Latescibacterota bacterium]
MKTPYPAPLHASYAALGCVRARATLAPDVYWQVVVCYGGHVAISISLL